MTTVDLEKYRSAWKEEQSFNTRKLSDAEIHKFIQSASKSLMGLFRKGLIFDIGFKLILFASFLVIIFLNPNQLSSVFISLLLILITTSGIIWQIKVYQKIPDGNRAKPNLIGITRIYIDFYYKYFIYSIFVNALSSSLLFLSGSLLYLYFKYHEIPSFQLDDYIVLGIGLALSYGLSVVFQLKHNNNHIKRLEKSLIEIEDNTITKDSIRKYRNKKVKNIVTISLFLFTGLVLLILLIFKLTH